LRWVAPSGCAALDGCKAPVVLIFSQGRNDGTATTCCGWGGAEEGAARRIRYVGAEAPTHRQRVGTAEAVPWRNGESCDGEAREISLCVPFAERGPSLRSGWQLRERQKSRQDVGGAKDARKKQMFGGAVLPSIRAGHGMPCPYGRGSEIPLCAAFAVPQGGRDAGAV